MENTKARNIAILVGIGLYVLSPVDLIPDAAIGLGQLDDIIVTALGVYSMLKAGRQSALQDHQS